MMLTESRAAGARGVLGASRATRNVAQQFRTRNEGHRVFLKYLSQFMQ